MDERRVVSCCPEYLPLVHLNQQRFGAQLLRDKQTSGVALQHVLDGNHKKLAMELLGNREY